MNDILNEMNKALVFLQEHETKLAKLMDRIQKITSYEDSLKVMEYCKEMLEEPFFKEGTTLAIPFSSYTGDKMIVNVAPLLFEACNLDELSTRRSHIYSSEQTDFCH